MSKLLGTLHRRITDLGNRDKRCVKGDELGDIKSKIGYLLETDIFHDLAPEAMAKIEQVTTMSTCEKGRVFYRPQEMGEVLFLLKRGRVQIYRLASDGRKLTITTVGSGTFFGEMSLIGQGMYNTFAEALEDCILCVMSRSDVERLLLDDPRIALRILEAVGKRLVDSEMRLEELAFKSIPARLAALLYRLAQVQGSEIEGMTHQELAEMVGTYRETATQTLNDFKAAGLIHIERRKIVVLDAQRLREIAEN